MLDGTVFALALQTRAAYTAIAVGIADLGLGFRPNKRINRGKSKTTLELLSPGLDTPPAL